MTEAINIVIGVCVGGEEREGDVCVCVWGGEGSDHLLAPHFITTLNYEKQVNPLHQQAEGAAQAINISRNLNCLHQLVLVGLIISWIRM